MSHEALARVTVRMHFDPAFVAAVHREPTAALAGLPLTAEEREDLLAVDPRAFEVDRLRRTRTLRDLIEEYPTSTTLALAATRRLASLDAFFSGPHFHDEVQRRGSLARAFGAFLRTLAAHPAAPPLLPETIRLEEAMARLRREIETPPAPPPRGRYLRAPGTAGLVVDGSTVPTVHAVELWLFEAALVPALSLCEDAPGLPPLPPPRPDAPLHLLLSPDEGGRLGLAEPGRVAVEALVSLEEPLDETGFVASAGARGLRPDLARRLLGDLLGAGWAIRGD